MSFSFKFGVQDDAVIGLPLLLMGARHYAPELGRFIQPDPAALEANAYGYVANNPVSSVDPDGKLFWFVVAAVVVVAARLAAPVVIRAAARFVASSVVQWIRHCQRKDWVRLGYTVIPNSRYGIWPPGGYTRVWAIRGGGTHPRNPAYNLPFHYHIHQYNWNKPWMWFG